MKLGLRWPWAEVLLPLLGGSPQNVRPWHVLSVLFRTSGKSSLYLTSHSLCCLETEMYKLLNRIERNTKKETGQLSEKRCHCFFLRSTSYSPPNLPSQPVS